jgi:hypothetical protein
MRKANLAIGELDEPILLQPGRRFREVPFAAPDDLPIVDLVELYVEIESSLGGGSGLIVQFVTATSGFDSEQVASDMAWTGASVLGRRLLVISCNPPHQAGDDKSGRAQTFRLTTLEDELVKVEGHELYFGDLRSWHAQNGTLLSGADIDRHLEELCRLFDMIVLVAPPADRDPLCTVLARHVDGNVIVLEAERTRHFAAIRLREMLARSGRPIVGTVLNNRRNYIPRWLAKLL